MNKLNPPKELRFDGNLTKFRRAKDNKIPQIITNSSEKTLRSTNSRSAANTERDSLPLAEMQNARNGRAHCML